MSERDERESLKDQIKKNPSGPITVRNLKVTVDRDLCIGAATCLAIAPQTFTLDDEAKAIFLDTTASDSNDDIIDAARGCPTAAIIVEDVETGKQVYP